MSCSKPCFPQLGGSLLLCLQKQQLLAEAVLRDCITFVEKSWCSPLEKGMEYWAGFSLFLCFPAALWVAGQLDAATSTARGLGDGPPLWKALCPLTFINNPPQVHKTARPEVPRGGCVVQHFPGREQASSWAGPGWGTLWEPPYPWPWLWGSSWEGGGSPALSRPLPVGHMALSMLLGPLPSWSWSPEGRAWQCQAGGVVL